MNDQGAFVAALLDASRKAYAAGAVLRLQEAGGEAAQFVDSWGFSALVADAEIRLQHLAEALACGRVEVFVGDIEWLAQTYAARGMPNAVLSSTLTCLRDELADSLPENASTTVAPYFEAALERLAQPATGPTSVIEEEAPLVDVAREFLAAVLAGERLRAEQVILTALEGQATVPELHLQVIAKAQAEIGRMWQAGEIRVADEHFCSRIVEDVLARLRAKIVRPAETGLSVLTASVAGNLHDIGPRIVGDHFEMNGWRSFFLGADMPKDDLVEAVSNYKPDLVALSVGLGINLRASADAIAALRKVNGEGPIIVGGRPFAAIPDLWKAVGADASATDAANAVELGTRLVRP